MSDRFDYVSEAFARMAGRRKLGALACRGRAQFS